MENPDNQSSGALCCRDDTFKFRVCNASYRHDKYKTTGRVVQLDKSSDLPSLRLGETIGIGTNGLVGQLLDDSGFGCVTQTAVSNK